MFNFYRVNYKYVKNTIIQRITNVVREIIRTGSRYPIANEPPYRVENITGAYMDPRLIMKQIWTESKSLEEHSCVHNHVTLLT